MEVKIGVQHAPREVVLETNESVADIEKQVADAVKNNGTLAIDDVRGRKILVPGDKIAYVEIGGGVGRPGGLPLTLTQELTLSQPWFSAPARDFGGWRQARLREHHLPGERTGDMIDLLLMIIGGAIIGWLGKKFARGDVTTSRRGSRSRAASAACSSATSSTRCSSRTTPPASTGGGTPGRSSSRRSWSARRHGFRARPRVKV